MKKLLWILAILAVMLGLLAFRPFSPRWIIEMAGTPEQLDLRVRRSDEGVYRFQTRLSGDGRHIGAAKEVVLNSGRTPVPGGEIVFSDTTCLPGTFRIRLADKILLIQENGVKFIEA